MRTLAAIVLLTTLATGATTLGACVSDAVPGETPCDAGKKRCDGACVEKSDPRYGCGDGCDACQDQPYTIDYLCTNTGKCLPKTCATGRRDCDTDPSSLNGCESALNTRVACGDCANRCKLDEKCDATGVGKLAECRVGDCATGTDCAGVCVLTQISESNCGTCGNACGEVLNGKPICRLGVCGGVCADGSPAKRDAAGLLTCPPPPPTCAANTSKCTLSKECCSDNCGKAGYCLCAPSGSACRLASDCCGTKPTCKIVQGPVGTCVE
jgi:hypothetical protein